jgi:hypothetical protein
MKLHLKGLKRLKPPTKKCDLRCINPKKETQITRKIRQHFSTKINNFTLKDLNNIVVDETSNNVLKIIVKRLIN